MPNNCNYVWASNRSRPLPAPNEQLRGDPWFPRLTPPFPHSPGSHLGFPGELAALCNQQCRQSWRPRLWAHCALCSLVPGDRYKDGDMAQVSQWDQLQDFAESASPLHMVSLPPSVPQSHRQPSGKHEKTRCLRMETTCKKWKGRNIVPVTCQGRLKTFSKAVSTFKGFEYGSQYIPFVLISFHWVFSHLQQKNSH